MTQLLNDNVYNEIMSSQDEDLIFDKFASLIPDVCRFIKNNSNNYLEVAKRVFSIIDKILTMFLTDDQINDLPDERKNLVLNVKSSAELVVNKLKNDNVDLKDKELVDSINVVLEFFNKMGEEQKELTNSLENINKTLEKGEKDILDNLTLNKISNFCKENINKPKSELNIQEIDFYIDEIFKMLKKCDSDIVNKMLEDFKPPEISKENLNEMKAYNMISSLKILYVLKN
tara:strand:+ start:454 stop:1143 length:690 start_codon:yes stop_codon:yes gene_type:complete